jgi:large subunit ribosomal protein L17
MLAGLAAALFREERIRTTETKARRLRPVAERLITTAKEGTVASRRRALRLVEDRDVIHKLYSDIAPRFADRPGGYTRIIKLAPRKGDAAPLVLIELVEGAAPGAKPSEEEPRRRLLRRRDRAERGKKEAEEAEPPAEKAEAPAEPPAAEAEGSEPSE